MVVVVFVDVVVDGGVQVVEADVAAASEFVAVVAVVVSGANRANRAAFTLN